MSAGRLVQTGGLTKRGRLEEVHILGLGLALAGALLSCEGLEEAGRSAGVGVGGGLEGASLRTAKHIVLIHDPNGKWRMIAVFRLMNKALARRVHLTAASYNVQRIETTLGLNSDSQQDQTRTT